MTDYVTLVEMKRRIENVIRWGERDGRADADVLRQVKTILRDYDGQRNSAESGRAGSTPS